MDADRYAPPHPMGAAPPELVAFLKDCYRPLVRTAMYDGASKDEAQDAVQDALIEFAKRWRTIDDPPAYLRRSVINNVRKIWRSERNRAIRQSTYVARNFERPPDEPNVWDNRDVVEDMFSKLTPSQHEIVRCMWEGHTQAETAVLLGRSPEAIRSALTDIRKRLIAAGYGPRTQDRKRDDIDRRSSEHPARKEDR